ncbi:MAG: type II toxin-antitoxin system RelE/ParE family toxin [Methylococcales bacterium]
MRVKRRLTGDDFSAKHPPWNLRASAIKPCATLPKRAKPKGLPSGVVDRLRRMLAYLSMIENIDELKIPPNFGAHLLTGDLAGTWSLTVTKNWRMTFRVNEAGNIEELDLKDYH